MPKFLKNPNNLFFLILLIALVSFAISLPTIKVNKKIGPLTVDTLGGYNLNFFGSKKDLSLKMGLDIKGGVQVVMEPDLQGISDSDKPEALNSLKNIMEARINRFGVNEPNIYITKFNNKDRVVVEIPGIKDVDRALNLIGKTAQLSFQLEKPQTETESTESLYTPQFEDTNLLGKDVAKSQVDIYQNEVGETEPSVKLIFTEEGKKKFADITRENIGRRLAILLDGQILIAPNINSEIPSGEAYITGGFTLDTAKDLAVQINSGALPVPVKVLSQNRIGPTIGLETVQKSVYGGVIGLILVVAFMLLNYKKLGAISAISLFIYTLLTLSLYKLIPITLTLPGIAGFILSIGMAVDSNILIFEKTKDELRQGVLYKQALITGFGKAWNSIKDANLATLITAFILFNPFDWGFLLTSGPIRGFAATLSLGVIISLFTGVFITQNLIKVFYKIK